MNKFVISLTCLVIVWSASRSQAQEVDLLEMRKELNAFAITLEEKLGFRDGAALFGMNRGTVNSVYLFDQGILLEIRTPLASARNRLQLTSLQSAMRTLQIENPFEQFLQQNSSSDLIFTDDSQANTFYQSLLDRIATIDSALTFSRANQDASDSTRLLRELGNITEVDYEKLRMELQDLKVSMDESVVALANLEEDMQTWFVSEEDGSIQPAEGLTEFEPNFSERLNTIVDKMESLEQLAVDNAQKLANRAELAEESYLKAWQEDVLEFELSLFDNVCSSRSLSQLLPTGEKLTFLLKGIGEETVEVGMNSDKVHVLNKSDLTNCNNERINASELIERSHKYNM